MEAVSVASICKMNLFVNVEVPHFDPAFVLIEMSVSHPRQSDLHPRVIFALGVLGNLLIILTVMQKRSFKSPTNTFLASLASTDLLLILICTPIKVLDNNILALGTETYFPSCA